LEIIVLKVKPNRNEVAISVIVNVARFIVYKIKFLKLNIFYFISLTLTANGKALAMWRYSVFRPTGAAAD
jgi:hypothetical protein